MIIEKTIVNFYFKLLRIYKQIINIIIVMDYHE